MDGNVCHVVYVNRNVRQERLICVPSAPGTPNGIASDFESGEFGDNLRHLLRFSDVHLCANGASCIAKLFQLHDNSLIDMKPTIILIDTPHDEPVPESRPRSRSPSPHSHPSAGQVEIHHTPDEEVYGLKLLQRIITEAHLRSLSRLVVPIPVISYDSITRGESVDGPLVTPGETVDGSFDSNAASLGISGHDPLDRRLVRRCLDLGAADVIVSPIDAKCIIGLQVHAYRAHLDAGREQQAMLEVRRGRKRSWIGVNEEEPFAYLREAMVAGLMRNICRSGGESDDKIMSAKVAVSLERQRAITQAIGQWRFSAHEFTDDELLVASMLMFRHALGMSELEHWRIPSGQLINFLVACRAAYNSFVPYHNFRHVVDVLQATFHFLVTIGSLPPYPLGSADASPRPAKSPVAALLGPFEALTLLITAIGHDVGHPGVNNGFLVTLNTPLAQLYNDRSVLESFHCAAYSQILRRYWPAAFGDKRMRNLLISSILATDMGLHFDYMKKMGDVSEKLQANNTTDGWNGRMLEEQKALACSLLMKCADISNVAREYSTASKWMHILSDEFSRQASMEGELGIPSSLMAPPKEDAVSLVKAQLGFMNLFAIPLFQGVAHLIPAMQYTVDELEANKERFEQSMQADQAIAEPDAKRLLRGGTLSPRTMSFAVGPNHGAGSLSSVETANSTRPVAATSPPAEEFTPSPTNPVIKPPHLPDLPRDYKEVNGIVTNFDNVADFEASDPFHMRDRMDSCTDSRQLASGKQRCSEATDGSASGPYSGDWASQVTSATTGKMPLSPSTQGTSIVSRESLDRPASVPVSAQPIPEDKPEVKDDESASNGSISKVDGKGLKKRPSRFRMNAFPFFRRHKGSSPPMPGADSVG